MAGEDQSCTGTTVLVVDDSKTVRQTASGYLTAQGYTVETACDGFEALAKIVDCQPDLIFADIMMPRLDGYQTCALVKNNAGYRHIPVVMLSSKDGLFDRARGRVVGADAHLSKPFSLDTLLATVDDFLAVPTTDPTVASNSEFGAAGMDHPVSPATIGVSPG